MSTKEATCAQRIDEAMASREADIKAMVEQAEGTEYYGDEEAIYEYALAVSKYTVVKIELSWGGPSDYLECRVDDKSGLYSVTYHFQDWYDGAEREVEEGSYLWQYADSMIEGALYA